MNYNESSLALIISRQDYRESDLLVTLYTENYGKLKLLARGAKKFNSKLAPFLEPLSLIKILIIPGKSINYLASASEKHLFLKIKEDYLKLESAGLAFKIFNKLVQENENDQVMFNYLLSWLESLEKAKNEKIDSLLTLFLIRFIDFLGYQPSLKNCLACQSKLRAGQQLFNFKLGGLVCSSCLKIMDRKDILAISENAVKLLRFLQKNQTTIIVKKPLIKELNIFLMKFLAYHS